MASTPRTWPSRPASSAGKKRTSKIPPLESEMGGDRRKKLQQIQQAVAPLNIEHFTQWPGQRLLAQWRHESRARLLPKGALDEALQPPLPPALHRPAVNPKAFPQDLHAFGREPMPERRHQNHDKPDVNAAAQESDRRRRVPLPAAFFGAAKTIPPVPARRPATRLPRVVRPMQPGPAVNTALPVDLLGQIAIDVFQ